MCIDFDGRHSDGSSFIYVSDILILLYKKKPGKESHYIVSRPELGSDPPIGSDRESGCDTCTKSSPTSLNMQYVMYEKQSSKQRYLFYLWTTLRY